MKTEDLLQNIRDRIVEYASHTGDRNFFFDVIAAEVSYSLLLKELSELDLALSKGEEYPRSWRRTKVLVNGETANCAACGGTADPTDEWHVKSGPSETNGCRARFTAAIHVIRLEEET